MIEFNFDWVLVLQLVIAAVLPLFVGLVTKFVTSSGWKASLLAILSFATALLTEILNALVTNTTYDLGRGLLTGLITLVTAIALHFGIWKPSGATATVQAVGSK